MRAKVIVELMEEVLLRRFTELNREEIRQMFQLHDLRESRVWQEAHDEGKDEGRMIEKLDIVRRMLTKGRSLKEIADCLKGQ